MVSLTPIFCILVVSNVPSRHCSHWFFLAITHDWLRENGPKANPYIPTNFGLFLDFGCMDLKQPQTFIAMSCMDIRVYFASIDVLCLLQALMRSSEEIFLEIFTHIFYLGQVISLKLLMIKLV